MKAKTIQTPDVSRCDAALCSYNANSGCRAQAITIGEGSFPGCDTFLGSESRVDTSRVAGVGACKVVGCKYNSDLGCQADEIVIAAASAPPACQTFAV